jgi:decaprenylphospho-beta-D-ribofuranose 2-oxidase
VLTSHRPATAERELRSLSGWGGWPATTSEVVRPTDVADLAEIVANGREHIARGLGRSYGDAAQLAGGTVVDMTALSHIDLDTDAGTVTALAGTSLGKILEHVVPRGWFLPVTPGTRHVTVGGAIAADVHGKNHHRDGSFGRHVESLELITGDGRVIEATPGGEAFSATVGGMGLTGVITKATFRLIAIETGAMSVHTTSAPDLPTVMQALHDTDARYPYSVAWLDLCDRGRGRGLVMGANHSSAEEVSGLGQEAFDSVDTLTVPDWSPRMINNSTVNLFNRVWDALGRRRTGTTIESLTSYFYPLDRIGSWNRLYGRKGFLQYQFVVPHDQESVLLDIAEKLAEAPTPVALAVLKQMGDRSPGYISFPMQGWTLAVDMPLGDPDLVRVLDECDLKVANGGGRVYLAKDSRLRPALAEEMYPNISTWRAARARLDPEGRLRSNLSQRLDLTS